MPYFTIFQEQLFPTAELSRGEKEKLDNFLRILEESGVGDIIHNELNLDKGIGGRTPYNPYRLFAAIIYAFSKHSGSLRKIEESIKFDLRFIYLLNQETPSYVTISKFLNNIVVKHYEDIFSAITKTIMLKYNLSFEDCFVDGTKIEANANKYKFVYKPTTFKNNLFLKIKDAFTWFKTSNTTDFTGGFLNGTYDANGDWDPAPFYVTDDAGVTFDINGGGISKFTSINSAYNPNNTGNYTRNTLENNLAGSWVITDANNKQHTMSGRVQDWANFIIAHEVRHYISYPTTNLHSLKTSGLIRRRGETRWFTFNGSGQVKASQFISYSMEQLCALDGYLTSYSDGTTVSADERDIINTIYNTYFVNNSSNQTAFKNMVAAALLEKNSFIDNDSYYYVGTPTYNNKNKIYYTITATQANTYDTTKKYYNRVTNNGHYDYLEVDISNVTNSNYSSYYFVEATRIHDYYNSSQCYQMLEVDDYDIKYINDFMVTNIFTSTKVNSSKPFEYLNYTTNVTVEDYLKSLVTEVTKNDFIAYCVSHQNAYAKLLMTLLSFDETTSTNSLSFPYSLGSSTDPGAVSISEFTAYSNLSVQEQLATIEGTTYNYGYTFSSVEIALNSNSIKVYLNVAPLAGTTNLGYSIDSESVQYESIDSAKVIEINLSNNSSLQLISNQNVLLYEIQLGEPIYKGTLPDEVLVDNDDNYINISNENPNGDNVGTIKPGKNIYALPSLSSIQSKIESDLFNNNVSLPQNITFETTIYVSSMCNSGGNSHENRFHRFVIDEDKSNQTSSDLTEIYTSSAYVKKNILNEYTGLLDNSAYGKAIGVVTSTSQNGTYAYYNQTTSTGYVRIKIWDLVLSIDYYFTSSDLLNGFEITGVKRSSFLNNSSLIIYIMQDSGLTSIELCTNVLELQSDYSTRFSNFVKDATYNLVPVDYTKEAYINSLTSNTYYVDNSGVKSLATGEYSSTETYYTYDGSTYAQATINEATYYSSMTSNVYYKKSGNNYSFATGAYDSATTYYVRVNSEYKEATIPRTNLVDLLGLNEVHSASDYCVPELLEKIITTSNEAFLSFYNNSVVTSVNNVSDYELTFRSLINSIGHYVLADGLVAISSTLSDDVKEMMAAAYLVTN